MYYRTFPDILSPDTWSYYIAGGIVLPEQCAAWQKDSEGNWFMVQEEVMEPARPVGKIGTWEKEPEDGEWRFFDGFSRG